MLKQIKPGNSETCCNCEQIAKGEQEGTCLVCGAVWEFTATDPRSPGFVAFHRDQVNFGAFGL